MESAGSGASDGTGGDALLTYSGDWLDRASAHRQDPEWIAAILARPDARVIPLWRDRCLVTEAKTPVTVPADEAAELLAAGDGPVFLGLDGEVGVFAADLSGLAESDALSLAGAAGTADVRHVVGSLTAAEAAAQAYARGILHWHRNQRHCGACGARTEVRAGGHLRVCTGPGCGNLLFPRIEPAIIVLVEAPDGAPRCLLGRHRGAPPDSYGTLAGFLEIGESLEDAVRREVAEEAGVKVGEVAYVASQPWPFPAGLMVGFRARAISLEIAVDRDELEDARWFTAEEVRRRRPSRPDAIDRYLVDAWLAEIG
ncbi:NAD(+) diphosphatase [Planosporangium sp. 12N6]|uniref:NAD(+) diphosphatase n=1 Tax=Planosporangium spinosum TaxID=3402278 RepID=UPI003CF81260